MRIPAWSEQMTVKRNGETLDGVLAGTYLTVSEVQDGNVLELVFDMTPHFWQGNYEVGGKTSVYTGPILLAYDQRFNDGKTLPSTMKLSGLTVTETECEDTIWPSPNLLLETEAENGERVVLCDFATAGQTGTTYTTWLPTENELEIIKPTSKENRWCQRIRVE